ncbi:MAG: helix-turn-helix transcriptional regulator [bacterium]|nr:helix-turn-helix transcriptional regulator [bacterium]
MAEFRYPQFCPLARAAEVLGERWTLLILRELNLGPQRFSDIRRRLGSVSSSVLTERLARLEARGLVQQRALAPPAASTVYELAAAGEAARPLLHELMRWGTRFLLPPVSSDQFEPSWMLAAVEAFALQTPTPAKRFELHLPDGDSELVMRVAGGASGTHLIDDAQPVDATVWAEPLVMLSVLAGLVDAARAQADGALRVRGDDSALCLLPDLFDLASSPLADLVRPQSD